MSKAFEREPRYVVFKIKDAERCLNDEQRQSLNIIGETLSVSRFVDGKPPFNAVVVEQDWPEFDVVWSMIEARMTGKPDELTRLRADNEQQATRIAELERQLLDMTGDRHE